MGRQHRAVTRAARTRAARRRAVAAARRMGCTCDVTLMLSPLDGSAVFAERPNGKAVYITSHESWCPLTAKANPDEYVILRPPTGR